MKRTLFDKVWDAHVVSPETDDTPAVLYIDLHLVHEVTSPQAFSELDRRGLKVRCPERTLATVDHSIPTVRDGEGQPIFVNAQARHQVETLEVNCAKHGIHLSKIDSLDNGIVHVVAPEFGATQPGMTIVCGDSHTSTHGAFGALAFGIGTTEVGHVLATQSLLQRKPKTMAIEVEGDLPLGVSAKDLILAIIGRIGVGGGTGYVIEYRGEAIRSLPMEERMTLCNMSIEAGARAGMIAPDDVTFHYLLGRRMAPKDFAIHTERWLGLGTDEGACFDQTITIDVSGLEPQVTWGINPEQVVGVTESLPEAGDEMLRAAFEYTGMTSGQPILGTAIDTVFIGSCTNGRISDLRAAACILMGQTVKARTLIVPGSEAVRAAAEREGLHRIFIAAGAEWRLPGCSMCIAMNGDFLLPGQAAVSTSNRNFAGRQGKGSRTLLASPITAAASAIAGAVADPREYL